MGVRITGHNSARLWDSVSGLAFGPVFETETDAEAFLVWYRKHKWHDLRVLSDDELTAVVNEFHKQRSQ